MTTETKTFSFGGLELRSVVIDGNPWFVAADVCSFLEIPKGSRTTTLRRLDDAEKGRNPIKTVKGEQLLVTVSEAGLYRLVMRSDKPKAREFQSWVTSTVLPAVLQTACTSRARRSSPR